MIPAVKSLLYNSNVEKIYLLIEDDVFPYELPPIIETINFSQQKWFSTNGPNYNGHWTYMGLARAVFTKLFPELDIILSLDVDSIVDKDISELWDFLMDNYYFAAAREPILSNRYNYLYTNSGIILMNLKKLREDKKDDEIIFALNTKRYQYTTQDCMNEKCQGKILELLSDFNVCSFTEKTEEKRIIHFANRHDWRNEPVVLKYKNMTWEEVLRKKG